MKRRVDPDRRDARRHRPLHRVHRLEDRRRQDGRRPPRRRPRRTSSAAVAIMVVTVLPMAWRWQKLLAGRGIHDRLGWLTRAYFTAYTAGQVLPTSIGGDAMRIFETTRRHPGQGGPIAGSVLLERALGGAATLALAGDRASCSRSATTTSAPTSGSSSASWSRPSSSASCSSRAGCGGRSRWTVPLLRRARLEKPLRAVYEGIHAYRGHPWLLRRRAACSRSRSRRCACSRSGWPAKSVGVDLSPRVYYVMGPLLFLVMLVPFTINGLAVREAFFVSFLTKLGVERGRRVRDRLPLLRRHDRALAAGRGDPRLGGAARHGAAAARPLAVADVTAVTVTYNGLPWIEQCLESLRGHRDGPRRPRLDRRDARARPRAVPGGAGDRAGEHRATAAGLNAGFRAASARYYLADQLRRLGRRRRGRAARRLRRRAPRGRGRRPAARATRTARSSARCAASRRPGGSRPSTSSCASSRRARAR